MIRGVVKSFNETKGYGFIKSDDGPDVFVHVKLLRKSGIHRSLNKAEQVLFAFERGPKGLIATHVALP